jgi:hypothetical protein
VTGVLMVLLLAGCGSGGSVVGQHGTPVASRTEVDAVSATTNQAQAQAEAERLLALVVAPPASVELTSAPPSSLTAPPMGLPAPTTSLVDDRAFWMIPMSMTATLAWIAGHPPTGLIRSGSGSSSTHGVTTASGYQYNAPPSAAWTQASVHIGVVPTGPESSVVTADATVLWIDPVPLRDTQPGSRLSVSAASGCPPSDRGIVGVTGPAPPPNSSLLPPGAPTAGLVCEYSGLNGDAFGLRRKTVLDATAADAFSARVRQLPLGHVDGRASFCPMDDRSATLVALVYPGDQNIDLWMETTGCATVSNGEISASGSVSVS